MIVALIDNGSVAPAAHRNLRSVAAALTIRTGIQVHAVSWKHSDRIRAAELDDIPAWTLTPFVRAMVALGQRKFVFMPFFISAQGAIGSALRDDLEKLRRELGGFEFTFTDGLAARGALAGIIADRVRETMVAYGLRTPAVILVDHGGPSAASARLRDRIGDELRQLLGALIDSLAAASMEGVHPPLLADQLRDPGFGGREVVIAMLFLSPGRHAGPDGDVARLCRTVCAEPDKAIQPRCHITGLVGDHPSVVPVLATALLESFAAQQRTIRYSLASITNREVALRFKTSARLPPALPISRSEQQPTTGADYVK